MWLLFLYKDIIRDHKLIDLASYLIGKKALLFSWFQQGVFRVSFLIK